MKNILIVDDDPQVLAALKRALRSKQYNTYCVSSGVAALQVMQEQPIHLVLSDYLMPNMLGTALLAKIAIKWPKTQRLIISGHSDYDTVLKAIQTGVVHKFLAKPWSNPELVAQVNDALERVVPTKRISLENRVLSQHQALNQGIHLQAILNTVRDGIVTYNQSGIILSVNQSLLNCFNYPETELIGANLVQLIPAVNISESIQASAKLTGRKKTGEVFPLEFTCSDMHTQGFDHQLGVIRDITDWAVRETENRQLLAALDSCQDSYALFSASGQLIHCNQKFKQMYADCRPAPKIGVTYREFLLNCVQSGLFVDASAQSDFFVENILAADAANVEQQYQLGRNKWIQIHQTRVDNDCVISFHIDVSQSKRSQLLLQNALSEAQHANSARGRFLAMMSHEIRTPLNAVLGLLQLLRNSPLTEQQLEYIATAESSGRSLLNIITDILDYSKIDANKLAIEEQPCSLSDLCDSILEMIKTINNKAAVRLVLQLDPAIDKPVLVDRHRLRQILVNLLSNSLKFTISGEVVFKVERCLDQGYRFSVSDTGIGISQALQATIFDEFTQANILGGSGTGLGLAICKRLVSLLGGQLEFSSVENVGSCFWFTLELMETEPVVERETHWVFEPGQQVLLVDDSETNRLVAGEMLKMSGLEVSYAMDGLEAITACRAHQYSLILMDISMPNMDGITATQQIRQLENFQQVPILALTAYAMEDEKERFMAIGMDAVIEKPLEKVLLLNTLAQYLAAQGEAQEQVLATQKRTVEQRISEVGNVLLDTQALDKLASDTSDKVLVDLVAIFIKDMHQRVTQLQQVTSRELTPKDLEDIERHYHSVSSSSSIYGLQRLSKKASQLEQKIKRQQLTTESSANEDITAFCQLLEQSIKQLSDYVEQRYCSEPLH